MKKRIYVLMLTLCVALSFCACGKKKGENATEAAVEAANPAVAECVDFVNTKLPAIAADRDAAVALYNEDFASSTVEPEKILADLRDTAIPQMETYINNLTAIEVTTPEVTEFKNLYLQSAQKQYEAMKMVVSAIEAENTDYLMQADNLISEADTLLMEFDTKLVTFASENGITLQTASGTDAQ